MNPINPRKIVVLSGAGISEPSGLGTFRSRGGLWSRYNFRQLATPEAWEQNPKLLLEFYNERRAQATAAQPNAGHRALAELETQFEVVIVTQNVDDLHERAGSTHVIHLHGELTKARSTTDPSCVLDLHGGHIYWGDRCPHGSQLRPHIVWFGESVLQIEEARQHFQDAGRVIVVGTSLTVFPAAGLLDDAPALAEKVLVDRELTVVPPGFRLWPGSADEVLPTLAQAWRSSAPQTAT